MLQPNGTLRCPQGATLYQQERRPEHDGTLRVLYSARIADCRACPMRIQCQGHGTSTKKPRRVSAVLHPLPQPAHPDRPLSPSLHEDHPPPCPSAPHPLLWGDWPRGPPRRAWIRWLRRHLVIVNAPAVASPPSTPSLLSRGSAGTLAFELKASLRTQCTTIHRSAGRDYPLWALNRVCSGPRFASRLSQQNPRHVPALDGGSSHREEQSVRFRSGAPRFHPFCCTRPMVPLTFSFFLLLFSLARLQNEKTSFSFFCLLATISLRIPWAMHHQPQRTQCQHPSR